MKKGKLIIILFFLLSCKEVIHREDFSKQNTTEIKIGCEKDRQIDFYIDCDIEYTEQPSMVMDFEFYRGKHQMLKGGLDPLEAFPKENESKTENNGINRWKFYGKLEGNFIPTADTIFTIKPTLIYNYHPNLKINKFELVLVR